MPVDFAVKSAKMEARARSRHQGNMNTPTECLNQARALRTDIASAPGIWLPRRDDMTGWLNAFVKRAEDGAYELGETEAADLVALDQFLRKKRVPVAQA
jgi:hypothetical protein